MKLSVEGMSCGHCEHSVTQAIQALDAAARVAVDLAAGTVVINGAVDPAQAKAAIEAEGYTVVSIDPGSAA